MRMTETEAIMWAVEKDPALRSDFTNITLLAERPDEDALRRKIEHVVAEFPRLHQRVVSPPLRLAPPEWLDDPTLDLDYHLRKVALPAPGGMRELLDLTAQISAAPFDRSRPLWEFTLVEGLEGGRTALVQKMHHTITDGVGGLKLSLSLVDFERHPPAPDPVRQIADEEIDRKLAHAEADPIARTSPLDVLGGALRHSVTRNADAVWRAVTGAARLALHPQEMPSHVVGAWRLAGSVQRQVLVTEQAHSPLMRPRSLASRFDVFSVPLEPAHEVARALGGSLNDFFVTGLTGALGAYHERMGQPVEELRMVMPVNLRTGGADGGTNEFAPSRLLVPLEPKDPAERFALTHERLSAVRNEPALGVVRSVTGFLAMLPTSVLVSLTRSQARTIDFAASNLRGSPVDLFIGGAHIDANYPMGPRTGCALTVTLLSYCGALHMGLHSDPASITDPEALLDCLAESFDALLAAG